MNSKTVSYGIASLMAVSGGVLLVSPKIWWPTYYDLPYMGYAGIACALVVALLYKVPQIQLGFAIIFALNASGDLGLYELYRHGFEYDKVIHVLSPMIMTIVLARYWGSWKKAVGVVLMCAIGWELYEFLADAILKTHLFGVYRHQVLRDTIMDLVMNVIGMGIGVIWVKK